jgi:hypothetical protein
MPNRVFKTAWFSKAAMKARISDDELCAAIRQVELGQADDLGGGVFKKQLDKNRHRSIILANAGKFWVFAYLFAKKDRANIDPTDLDQLRRLAGVYRQRSDLALKTELDRGDLEEICHEKKQEV